MGASKNANDGTTRITEIAGSRRSSELTVEDGVEVVPDVKRVLKDERHDRAGRVIEGRR